MIYGEGAIKSVPASVKDALMGTDSGLKLLAEQIAREIDAGDSQRKTRLRKYDRLYQYYIGDPPKPTDPPFAGASEAQKNIIQVKIDALGTNVARTLTSQEPYCVAQTFQGDEMNKAVEKIVSFFVKKGRAREKISSVSAEAGLFNAGVIYSEWSDTGDMIDPTPGPRYRPLEAHNFVVYPATVCNVYDAETKLVGHRYWLRRSQIDEAKKKKIFADNRVSAVDDPATAKGENYPSVTGSVSSDSAGKNANELVECWKVTFKDTDDDGTEVWWYGTIAKKDRVWLTLDRHKYTRPCYHVFRYKPVIGEFWSQTSVGNDLQGEQLSAMNLQRSMEDGIQMNIYGTVFTTSSGLGEQFKKFGPMEIIEGEFGSEFTPYNPKADLNFVPEAIQMSVNYADQIARISQAGTGGTLEADTATEATIIRAGQQAGVDDYLGNYSEGLLSLWEMSHEYLAVHKDVWLEKLGVWLGVDDKTAEALTYPTSWEPNTKSIGSTPGNQLQLTQMLNEMAAQGGYGISKLKLGEKFVNIAARLGLVGAEDVLVPDPQAIIAELAEATGIDPTLLAKNVDAAQKQQQAVQEGQDKEQDQKIGEAIAAGLGVPGEEQGLPMVPGVPAGV